MRVVNSKYLYLYLAISPLFLSPLRTALNCTLLQGYGLTETCATACISDPSDLTVGHVGPPLEGVDIKLVSG